jgi:RimJ/RimL family protein N-acetyltransferase
MSPPLAGPQIYKARATISAPQHLQLSDGSKATLLPLYTADVARLPVSLVDFLWAQFNDEVFRGDTYPHLDPLTRQEFVDYWFGAFHALLIKPLSEDDSALTLDELFQRLEGLSSSSSSSSWDSEWLGSYYIKPNYAGRASHICNAGFFVNPAKRGLSVGKALGRSYLEWAPLLGYVYSVFNLVFVSNVASVRIWDSLGFDRIGLIPGAGVLKGYEERVDAIVFGKKL